ncbi:MAG: MlaA family lipoprotein, partial [Litorimonas sp.]
DLASTEPELQYQKEDFGQTLGTYNVPAGPYIVLPLLGPSNLRDVVGRAGDIVANPVRRINFDGETEAILSANTATVLNVRAQQDGRLKAIRESADPYVNLRTLYNQSRETNIHEDSDPFDSFEDENFEDDNLADFE